MELRSAVSKVVIATYCIVFLFANGNSLTEWNTIHEIISRARGQEAYGRLAIS